MCLLEIITKSIAFKNNKEVAKRHESESKEMKELRDEKIEWERAWRETENKYNEQIRGYNVLHKNFEKLEVELKLEKEKNTR